MTRQAIETRTRLLIAKEVLGRALREDEPLDDAHRARVLNAYHSISRAADSLETLND